MNLKLYFLFLLLLGGIFRLTSQVNLVPNGGFEEFDTCPSQPNQNFDDVSLWENPNMASPEYFNTCNTQIYNTAMSIFFLYQHAKEGNAFAGLIAYSDLEFREYIQTKLLSPLEAGKTYRLSFYLSLGYKYSKQATKNIQTYFSTNSFFELSSYALPYQPQIIDEEGLFFTDTSENWQKFEGVFIASGGEEYMTIGNFFDNAQTEIIPMNSSAFNNIAYYGIDDVHLIEVLDADLTEKKPFSPTISPNPIQSEFSIHADENVDWEISLTSVNGLQILNQPYENKHKINTDNLSSGVYFLEVKSTNQCFKYKLIKN